MHILKDIEALLITDPTNIRYTTGFVGVDPTEREAYVVMTKTKTYLFISSLYLEQAKSLPGIVVEQISREQPISLRLAQICERDNITELWFEEASLTVAELRKLESVLTDIKLVPTQNRIEEKRMIKRKDEIENIKLAVRLTDQCFKFLTKRIRPGITEARLALEIEGYFKYQGAELAFSPIVAFNEHASQPHYMKRGNLPLRRGSLILLDFGAKIKGYCAEMTRVVFIGKPKDEWILAYNTVLKAQQAAFDIAQICFDVLIDRSKSKVEVSGAEMDKAARSVIEKSGLTPYSHSLGHNIGLAIHEGPRLSDKVDQTLKPGMVFSIEPGVYVEGQYGIRIEDLVRLTDTGVEILSKSPKEMIVL